jgi:hypothetical protein
MPEKLVRHLVTTCTRLHQDASLRWSVHAHSLVLTYTCYVPRRHG